MTPNGDRAGVAFRRGRIGRSRPLSPGNKFGGFRDNVRRDTSILATGHFSCTGSKITSGTKHTKQYNHKPGRA